MKLKNIPTVGNKISKEDPILLDILDDIIQVITDKFNNLPFTDAIILTTGLVYKFIMYREERLTNEEAGFENEHDIKRFNYFVRLINKRYGTNIPEVNDDK